jgi:hypothetical protein
MAAMNSKAFQEALTVTGYLLENGVDAPGLDRIGTDARIRPILSGNRIGLHADAVFSAQGTPIAIFKDSGISLPTEKQLYEWHEAAWNVGLAPLLWIITPTDIRLYDCYASPNKESTAKVTSPPLDVFPLDVEERMRALETMCGRFATETGAFWSSPIGQRIDRRHRVDRELLGEINALEELLTLVPPSQAQPFRDEHAEVQAARDFAQRLIGRCIFTLYLFDRGIAQSFLPKELSSDVSDMFSTVDKAFTLFEWLRKTFNGDLFPMDDPGAEHQRLGDAHLALLRDFIEGRSLTPDKYGQGRLFRFRFDAIPVDLISSIYQQFARSSAADEAHMQGLHYTPVELVHLTLDPVFEALPATARIIDPTCGSGAFLVEAFRRLVWKNTQGKSASRDLVRQILYNQLFGIDINRSALGIAAFSLYLAALELDEDPVSDIADLKFDRLIGNTLFQADTVNDELPTEIRADSFDAVVGNPPWTFVHQVTPRTKSKTGNTKNPRPRRSPDQEFLWVAANLAGEAGRIGMIMKASPFFSKDSQAIAAREGLFKKLMPVALVNLSALRREGLFPNANGPALLFFARCPLVPGQDRLLVGSIPWTPDFRRNGIFHIGPGEFRTIPLERVLHTPAMLKAATFGTVRDGWLIEKLERTFPTLETVLTHSGLDARGQGFQIEGGDINKPPEQYYALRVLTPAVYRPFQLHYQSLEPFIHNSLHRPRNASIFQGPLLICPKGNFGSAVEQGRYSAAVSKDSILYNKNFYGISFLGKDFTMAKVIAAILNSSLTTFQLAFGGSTWGLERPTVEPNDLLALRVPNLAASDLTLIQSVIKAEECAANEPDNSEKLDRLDQAVFDLYGLERDEIVLARESVMRARMFLLEGRIQRQAFIKTPSPGTLASYAGEVIHVVNTYLRARGKRHLEAIIYPTGFMRTNLENGTPGIIAIRFSMVSGAPSGEPIIRYGHDAEIEELSTLLKGQVNISIPPYLNERRQLRIYSNNDLFILKPSEVRYWTRSIGLNDADVILADHWLKDYHASII